MNGTDRQENGVLGLLLAGGQARRMGGGDKCLRQLGGRTLLERIVAIAAPQVDVLMLNANGDPGRFAGYELPVLPDVIDGFAGPLAGVLTGMRQAALLNESRGDRPLCWLATFPTDAPFLPPDMVARMLAAATAARAALACARSGGRTHPVAGLWSLSLLSDLEHALLVEDIRKIDRWTARHKLVEVEWPEAPPDPFFNANRPEDLAEAERLLALA